MAEPADAVPDSPDGFQRRHFGDQRDDFDDEFGRIRTPAEMAKRKLRVPAIMHIIAGWVCLAGTAIGAFAIIDDAFDNRSFGDDSEIIGGIVLAALTIFGGGTLFGLVFAGGLYMINLRRRRIALVAAYIVTGLSLGGPYGILFYPFGIWALILLYSESIKREFETPAHMRSGVPAKPPSEPKPRLTVRLLSIMGKIGFPIFLFILGMLLWDVIAYPRFWTTLEIVWSIGITLVFVGMFGAMLAYGIIAHKKFKPAAPVESPFKNDDLDD